MTSTKKRLHFHFGCHFCKINAHTAILRRFTHILLRFPHILPGFKGFCPDFHQIKTFGVLLHPLHLRLLHQWLWLMMSHHISRWLCFAPWMICLSLVIDFDNIRVIDLVHHWGDSCFSVVFLFILFMPIGCSYICMVCLIRGPSLQMLYLILLKNFWNAAVDASDTVYSFLHFRFVFRVFPALLYFESSVWHGMIAPVEIPLVAKLSLNK